MKLLIIGSGGREHALGWKLAESPNVRKLFFAPGNAGTRTIGKNIPVDGNDFEALKMAIVEHEIDMVVVGPEVPLVKGIHDYFLNDKLLKNIPVIGPVAKAAQLEGSKDFAKDFMRRHGIPTAAHQTFASENLKEGLAYLDQMKPPYVLKADGLASGKGVLIIDDLETAKKELTEMINDAKFGEASSSVVVEEFLKGIELSVFILTDGRNYKILPEAKDYKRIGEGDTGLNTGGMGSISPVNFATPEFMQKVEDRIIRPTIDGLVAEGIDYKGFIFFGLINVDGNPFVIEYNCRMGDPEAESVIPRIKTDLLDLFVAVAEGNIDKATIEFDERFAASVMLVSGGYPQKFEKGKKITGIENVSNCVLFHAGTAIDIESESVKTSGGRVMAVTSYGSSMEDALHNAYENAKNIKFDGMYYRKDLGFDLKRN